MTHKQLSQYRYICREVEQLQKELDSMKGVTWHETVMSSDGPGGTLVEVPVRSDAAGSVELRRILRRRQKRLTIKRLEVETFLDSIPDSHSHIRLAIALKFIEGLSWTEVGNELNVTEGCIKQDYYRFMKSCSKCSDSQC